ncbi:hypothetical protein L1279_001143 [Planomicrobium sp. HSC-17F08]|nr:hypothetical protein [Planomicrobium sp. HSC-17F08]
MKPADRDYVLNKVKEMEANRRKLLAAAVNLFPKIEIPSYTLPNIDFSIFQPLRVNVPSLATHLNQYATFKIPKIAFPKIEIAEIDYERIETITNDNSKYGWTLTGEMGIGEYLEDDMIGASREEKDAYFYGYYSKKDWECFGHTKSTILAEIEPRWHDLIQDCFDSFENDKYRLVIPTLFTIIEGEMSYVFQSQQGSYNLIQRIEKKAKNEEAKMKQIALYSVVHSMKDQLFGSLDFSENRNDLVNRHRVLHGRDEPSQWRKVDALRLFNVISSLQFIKDILKEKE